MDSEQAAILGVDDRPLHLSRAAEHRELAIAMARQAKRSVHIHTRDFDAAIYDNEAMADALSELVRNSRSSRVMILVQDTSRAVNEGHALVRLAQRLSSRVEIRVPCEEHRGYNEAFFVADVTGFIRRPQADLYPAEASYRAPFEARKLVQYFEQVWERAEPDPQLRRLFI